MPLTHETNALLPNQQSDGLFASFCLPDLQRIRPKCPMPCITIPIPACSPISMPICNSHDCFSEEDTPGNYWQLLPRRVLAEHDARGEASHATNSRCLVLCCAVLV